MNTYRFHNPLPCKRQHFVLEFSEKETFARAPLCVEADGDGHRQCRLRQDVGQGAAVQVVAQDVLAVLAGIQPRHKQDRFQVIMENNAIL